VLIIDRGQIPPKDLLRTEDIVDLVYLDVKYYLKCTRSSVSSWTVSLKGKERTVEAEIRPLVKY
jgi:hypothetical protein